MYLKSVKKSVYVTMTLLLICIIMMISVSYAWLSMSRSPEITGINTNVGANGSLEIALLTDATYMDPSLIRASVGDSAVEQDLTVSNLSWGNVIDLSDVSYGLSGIVLHPSRLNVSTGWDGGVFVNHNMLTIPTYGTDGRAGRSYDDTVSAVLREGMFFFSAERQSYGVRCIGTILGMTPQQIALATARSSVQAYISGARSAIALVWETNGEEFVDILYRGNASYADKFSDMDVTTLRGMASDILVALNYIDMALRQGVIGYGAPVMEDIRSFQALCTLAEDSSRPLSEVAAVVSYELPDEFWHWVSVVEKDKNELNEAIAACDALEGDHFVWRQIFPIVERLINLEGAYLGQEKLSAIEGFLNMTSDNELTLGPGSGALAHIADFVGDYQVFFTYAESSVEAVTVSTASRAHLWKISDQLESVQAIQGPYALSEVPIIETYGYAVDMAFRCNAASDLLLQTTPELRVEADTEVITETEADDSSEAVIEEVQTQGGGSYMRFFSDRMSVEQIVRLMDGIRIGFVNDQNELVSMAKLNTSNYQETEEGVSAPLYLYSFSLSDSGLIIMGERQDTQSQITWLPEDKATVLTIVVWLDGDHVSNSLVSDLDPGMVGTLNLQFASSTELVNSGESIENND